MGTPVFVNANGQLGTTPSSARFKDQIKPMDKASEAVLALKPVTFHYKKELDPQGIPQFGLVAEEVEKVNRDLVTRDAEGKVYTVRYEAVNAMLLNEFLKQHRAFLEEHRKVEEQGREAEEQQATIAELKSAVARQRKEMETVVAHLKEQDSKIQNVSAQVEMGKFATRRIRRGGPAPRMVLNP
jgi:septal ring factor EnvC (AmiA/AmiB activator)